METPVVLRHRHQSETEICPGNGADQTCLSDTRSIGKGVPPISNIENSRFELFSSSPNTSPRTSASPTTVNDLDAYTQGSEPVPFSSTPDLGSRTASSSPTVEYDSQVLVTPPEENFIRALDRKLRALLESQNFNGPSSAFASAARARAQDKSSPASLSTSYVVVREPAPSSLGSGASETLKRKRSVPPSRGTSLENTEVTGDADSDTECEDTTIHPKVPVSKKLKETSFNYTVTETASARRARSLSASSSQESMVETEKAASPSPPSTPVYKAPAVPIIAPPPFDAIPRPPLSADDAAEARLKVLLQRERRLRKCEGLDTGIDDIFDSSATKEQVDELLGIDEEFRKEVISWILQITPSKKLGVSELRHQLRTCPETRFHAIVLFTRYFMRVGDAMPIATEKETPLMRLGRKRITWDVAMSCLALSVKFNRDFLGPFSPVYAREFLVLAPHPMSHDDFEISQKDVLQALDYEVLDVTPGPYMQEIWNSLSSLRNLLSVSDGWEVTQLNAWHIINASATASEMIQFPIFLLTAAAIIEGSIAALMDVCEQDTDNLDIDADKKARDKAEASIADVVMDIRELMDITFMDMKRCRRWLQKIIRAAC